MRPTAAVAFGAGLAAALAAAGCKDKARDATPGGAAAGSATAAVPADAAAVVAVDAAVDAVATVDPPMPSVQLVADGLGPLLGAGPARTPDGKTVVWCTRGDNGMADWVETICHVVPLGKKPTVIPVMTYADAMAVDEGIDGSGDPDAGARSTSARARVAAAVARLGEVGGAGLVALPRPVGCSFVDGEFTFRNDELAPTAPGASSDAAAGCVVDGVTASVNPQGKVTVVSADQILFTEVFKPRARGKGEGGDACYLEVGLVGLAVDRVHQLVAISIGLSNPSDGCALVTEYEVRAVRLP